MAIGETKTESGVLLGEDEDNVFWKATYRGSLLFRLFSLALTLGVSVDGV